MDIKERPRCRKKVEELLGKYHCTLEELWKYNYDGMSDGLLKQTKKMIIEKGNPEKLTLTSNDWDTGEKWEKFHLRTRQI